MRLLRSKRFVRDYVEIYSESETYLDPEEAGNAAKNQGLVDIKVSYLTRRFNPEILGLANKIFASVLYTAGAPGHTGDIGCRLNWRHS